MARFDEVVAAATRRLGLDRELQLEVARELRGHLEDSAGEYVAAGYPPEEASAEAVKRLGDTGQLAEDLWRANRWRLRVRAVAKWAAQVALVPAAVVVAVVVVAVLAFQGPFTTIGTTVAALRWLDNLSNYKPFRLDFSGRELASLTPDQRWVLVGNPAAKTPLEKARSIVTRWPDNPVYYGDYANWGMIELGHQAKQDPPVDGRSWYLPLLHRGEQLEPGNGYYNLCRAMTFLDRVGELDVRGPAAVKSPQSAPTFTPSVLTLRDAGAMEQALAELHKALAKPKLTSHTVEMAQLRLAMLPPPKTVLEYLHRQFFTVGVLLPDLGGVRKLARTASAYAWVLAQQGELARAQAILHDVSVLGSKQAVDGDCLIQVLVGHSIAQMAGEYAQVIAEGHGTAALEAAAAENRALHRAMEEIRARKDARFDYFRRAGVLYRTFLPAVPEYEPEPGPVRRAEQAVVQSAGFGAMLLLGSLLLVPAALIGLGVSLRRRAARAAPMVFVGWRRLGWVVLWGTVAPLAVYAAYIVSPLSNREFGVGYMPERFVVEWLAVAVAMAAVLKALVREAVYERAVELGVKPPQRPDRRRRWLARLAALTLLGLAVVTYIALWQFEGLRPHGTFFLPPGMDSAQPLFLFAMVLIVMMVVGLLVGVLGGAARFVMLWRRNRELALIGVRSSVPILAAAVLVLAVASRGAFSYAEARALAPIRGPGDLTMFNEVRGSAYRELVAFHQRRLERLQPSAGAPSIKAKKTAS